MTKTSRDRGNSTLTTVTDTSLFASLGVAKTILQTTGVDASGVRTPLNADGAGIFLVLRDDLFKIEVPVYAHISRNGFRLEKERSLIKVDGSILKIEFERPYISLTQTVDDIPFRDICNLEFDGHLALTANHGCIYFRDETACKFCAIPQWRDAEDRSVTRLALAVKEAVANGEVKHLSITTGTAPGSDRGIRSIIAAIERIRRHVEIQDIPIFAEFEPPEDLTWIDRLEQLGVRTVACNIEFLSSNMRAHLMPGKGQIPFDRFVDTWSHAVNLFGRGQVYSNVLMTRGEFSGDENLRSRELASMIEIGVIPSPGPLYPDPASQMRSAGLPSVAAQVRFLVSIAAKLHANGLDPRHALAGCHRNGAYSAINEFYAAVATMRQTSSSLFEHIPDIERVS